MWKLVVKDVKLVKPHEYVVLLLPLFFFVVVARPEEFDPFVTGVILLSIGLSYIATNREFTFSAEKMILSLPVSRKEYVIGKYASVFVWLAIGIVLMVLFSFVIHSFSTLTGVNFKSVLLSIFGTMGIFALLFPAMLIFKKAAMAIFVFVLVFIFNIGFVVLRDVTFTMAGVLALAAIAIIVFVLSFLLSFLYLSRKNL